MIDEYIYVTGPDGEIYEVRPTDALLRFLQRLAEDEEEEPERAGERSLLPCSETIYSSY